MAKRLILKGRVQGVGCRDYCARTARQMGISGFASNLRDGSVEVVLKTYDDAMINKFMSHLKENPSKSYFSGNISSITVEDYTLDYKNMYADYTF